MKKTCFVILFVLCNGLFLFAQNSISISLDKLNSSDLNVGDKILVGVFCDQQLDRLAGFQLYLEFNQQVLKYQKVVNKHVAFESDWIDNMSECCYAANWLTLDPIGLKLEKGEKLFDLEFIYNGGDTDITWQTKQVLKNNRIEKGETMFVDTDSQVINVQLIDGCVCE